MFHVPALAPTFMNCPHRPNRHRCLVPVSLPSPSSNHCQTSFSSGMGGAWTSRDRVGRGRTGSDEGAEEEEREEEEEWKSAGCFSSMSMSSPSSIAVIIG